MNNLPPPNLSILTPQDSGRVGLNIQARKEGVCFTVHNVKAYGRTWGKILNIFGIAAKVEGINGTLYVNKKSLIKHLAQEVVRQGGGVDFPKTDTFKADKLVKDYRTRHLNNQKKVESDKLYDTKNIDCDKMVKFYKDFREAFNPDWNKLPDAPPPSFNLGEPL